MLFFADGVEPALSGSRNWMEAVKRAVPQMLQMARTIVTSHKNVMFFVATVQLHVTR